MPFTEQQFLEVFREYNDGIWPMQAILFLLGIAALVAAMFSRRVASVLVASLWAWCGLEYHWINFARVSPAAWIFGLLFMLEAAAILIRNHDLFVSQDVPEIQRVVGFALVTYALIAYPAISHFAGHEFPSMPTFGAPCPLTIFTSGLLLFTTRPLPPIVAAIPLVWAAIASFVIVPFGMYEDLGLPIAGAALAAVLVSERFPRFKPAPV